MKYKAIFAFLMVLFVAQSLQAQNIPDSLKEWIRYAHVDSLNSKSKKKPKKKIIRVIPLKYFKEPGFHIYTTDSLKRWQLWTNPVEWENRQRGVITHRLGGMGKNDGYLLLDHGNNFRKVYFDGYKMNNPVTGGFNATRLPQHIISKYYLDTDGIDAVSRIRASDFYVIKPFTRVDYEQSKYGYRSLNALVTQNVTKRINVLGKYWGKSEQGVYNNSKFVGDQVLGRVTYHMNRHMVLSNTLLFNGWTQDQSDGYVIQNMNTFNFDRLNTRAKVQGGGSGFSTGAPPRSKVNSTIFTTSLYIRKDTLHRANFRITGFYDSYHRFYGNSQDSALIGNQYQVYPADSSNYVVRKMGFSARKTLSLGPTLLDVEANINRNIVPFKDNHALTKTFWTMYRIEARNEWNIFNAAKLNLRAAHTFRSDGFSTRSGTARFDWHVFKGLRIHASVAAGSQMPTIQELYWKSLAFKGQPNLKNQQIQRGEVGLKLQLSKVLQIGFKAYGSRYHNPIVLGLNRQFENIGTYYSKGGEAWVHFENTHWIIKASGTYQLFSSTDNRLENQLLNNSGGKLWDRFGVHWKGYALKRATYVKMGFYGVISPFSYRSAHYYPQLDIWQYMNQDQPIPSFFRVDFDLAARIRWFMIYMRFENLLDGLGQRGYFETADYPMTPRVFRFGIRVIFRN